jgi:ferredoxin-NADP reductase/phytoene dehydrogenase-like protein
MEKVDCIVIGAGNGGLIGALNLVKHGKKVLLLEKHNVPGGCATTFVRGRFEFDVALHQLYGINENPHGDKGRLRRIFEELNVFDKIKFVNQEEAFSVLVKGFGGLSLPGTKDGFVKTLQMVSPEEAEGIARFQELVNQAGAEYDRLYDFLAQDKEITAADFPCLFEHGARMAADVMSDHFTNPMVTGIYYALQDYAGIPMERLSFMTYAPVYFRGGETCNVKGGSQAMSSAIVSEFEACGGTFMNNTKVKEILIDGGRVTGVLTERGDVFLAEKVLCNANKVRAYVDMMNEEPIPDTVFENLKVSTPAMSVFAIFLGLDCNHQEVGIEHATNFVLNPMVEPNTPFDVMIRRPDKDIRGVYYSCYNVDDPEYSDKGTCVLSILLQQTSECWMQMAPSQYHEEKMKLGRKILDFFFDLHPEVRNHIEEIEMATPLTVQNYIGSPGGSIYDSEPNVKDYIANKFEIRSPIKGLYFCGSSVLMGGFDQTYKSGKAASDLMLRDFAQEGRQKIQKLAGMKGIEKAGEQVEALKIFNIDKRAAMGCVEESVNKYHPKRIDYRVVEIREQTATSKTIRLAPIANYLPPFLPGQYISVLLDVDGVKTSRPYTISSPSTQTAYYEITVRRKPDGFVSDYLLDRLKVGDPMSSTGPGGHFYHYPMVRGDNLVFIAGGSGITPFMSMLQTWYEKLDTSKKIHLIYGCVNTSEVIFEFELNRLRSAYPNLSLHLVISEPELGYQGLTGFITADLVQKTVGNLEGKTLFLCGPEAMYAFVTNELKKLGIRDFHVRREVHSAPADPTRLPGWPEEVDRNARFKVTVNNGKVLEARATEPLLNTLERHGITREVMCRSGECSLCRTKLLEGTVYHPSTVRLRKSDRQFGYIHPCVAFPVSNIRIAI